LNAGTNANGIRPKSPLTDDKDGSSPPPTAVRTGSVVRKGPTGAGAKKGSILSSKKTQKLGAKKVASADVIDFDEAERKAKEEADRIEKLGYDPEAEKAEAEAKEKATAKIASPTPISPSRASFGATSKAPERSSADVERLGMGIGRLGFGQVSKPAVAKKPGFGAVAPQRSAADGKLIPLEKRGVHMLISLKTQNWTRRGLDLVLRREFRLTNTLAAINSTLQHNPKPSPACKTLRVPALSLATPILVVRKRSILLLTTGMGTLRPPPRTLFAASALPLVMIWKT
jgi:hypothetical protein